MSSSSTRSTATAPGPDWVVDTTFDLFCNLGATDEQCEFPVIYASGFQGIAGIEIDQMTDSLEPLFDMVVKEVPKPVVDVDAPLQMLITNLDYDEFKGRIALGRVNAGTIKTSQNIKIGIPGEPTRNGKVNEVFIYNNFKRTEIRPWARATSAPSRASPTSMHRRDHHGGRRRAAPHDRRWRSPPCA